MHIALLVKKRIWLQNPKSKQTANLGQWSLELRRFIYPENTETNVFIDGGEQR
jgi:hypothetical protein